MKVYIFTDPLNSGHKVRGVGTYTTCLVRAMEREKDIELVDSPKKADIIHYPTFDLYKRTLTIYKKPTIVTIHDVIPLVYQEQFKAGVRGRLALYFQKRALHHVSAVITDSHCSQQDIEKLLQVSPEKVQVIPLGVSSSFKPRHVSDARRAEVRIHYDLPERYILYVGDVNWNKNIEGLIRAFATLKKKYQRKKAIQYVKLLMVGHAFSNTELSEMVRINELIGELKLDFDVIKRGYVPEKDLITIYNMALAYVQPSFYEGFGLPVLEAMACGVPVVSSNGGSLPEVLPPSYKPVSPDASSIAEELFRVLNYSSSQKIAVVEEALAYAAKYTWKRTAAETKKVYKSLMASV